MRNISGLPAIQRLAALVRQVDVAIFGLRGIAGAYRPVSLFVGHRLGVVDVAQDAQLLRSIEVHGVTRSKETPTVRKQRDGRVPATSSITCALHGARQLRA